MICTGCQKPADVVFELGWLSDRAKRWAAEVGAQPDRLCSTCLDEARRNGLVIERSPEPTTRKPAPGPVTGHRRPYVPG